MGATTGTFSDAGVGTAVLVRPGQTLDYILWCAGSDEGIGTVRLETSRNGGLTWEEVRNIGDVLLTFTGTVAAPLSGTIASGVVVNSDVKDRMYRWNCLDYDDETVITPETSDNMLWSLEPDPVYLFPAKPAEINSMCAAAVAAAEFTIGGEGTNVRAIAIQLKDALGSDLAHIASVLMGVFSAASGTAFATTGGSTGIAIGTDGALLAIVAKKLFVLTSEADGDIDLTWTDTGTEAVYLGIVLPNGKLAMSGIIQNAS
jgi:hypothetical protein